MNNRQQVNYSVETFILKIKTNCTVTKVCKMKDNTHVRNFVRIASVNTKKKIIHMACFKYCFFVKLLT